MPSPLSPSLVDAVERRDYEPLVTRQCSRCGEFLPFSMFTANRAKKLGIENRCKKCDAERVRNASKQSKAKFNDISAGGVYFIVNEYKLEHIKIGFTSSFRCRFKNLFIGMSGKLLLLAIVSSETDDLERSLHRQFAHLRVSDDSEWFWAKAELLHYLSTLNQDLAFQSLDLLSKKKQSRVVVPPIDKYIHYLPFL